MVTSRHRKGDASTDGYFSGGLVGGLGFDSGYPESNNPVHKGIPNFQTTNSSLAECSSAEKI